MPLYFASTSRRIWASGVPVLCIRITSRVMSRHTDQVAAWLVNVTWFPASALT